MHGTVLRKPSGGGVDTLTESPGGSQPGSQIPLIPGPEVQGPRSEVPDTAGLDSNISNEMDEGGEVLA